MSYLALARKYRPRTFADVLGQGHVVKALSHALAHDKLHPAILLTGTRGVGKTTLARIVAKGLNCEEGVRSEGCGVCSACQEVDQGRFVDLMEIDAASNTGVDNVRDLIDNAQYAPVRGRYKVYLIDEVHMLSKSAFNALLKTLEEPPPHVKFILATTDPQKLLVTVLSRCLQFNLKRLPQALIRDRLTTVIEAEGLEAEVEAVAEIARAADGSMRDGLSLLDQAIAFSGNEPLKREAMEEMLGAVGRRSLLELLDALAGDERDRIFDLLTGLEARAPDYAALLSELAAYLQQISLLQIFGKAGEDSEAELKPLADRISPEDGQLYYQITVSSRRDLPWAPDPRAAFEMAIMRMLAFQPEPAGGGARPRSARDGSSAPKPAAAESAEVGWAATVDAIGVQGMARQLAMHCAIREQTDSSLVLVLDPQYSHLLSEERRSELEQALHQQGQKLSLRIEGEAPPPEVMTPAQAAEAARKQRQLDAEDSIERDPIVLEMKKLFGATVRPGSVRPLDS